MDLTSALKYIADNWQVIHDAPAAAVLLFIAGILVGLVWHRRERSILNERLNAKDDQLARYKEKLDGATPEEVKAELEALKKNLRDLEKNRAFQ